MALYMSISNLQVQAFDPLLNLQNGTPTNQTKQASKHPLDADGLAKMHIETRCGGTKLHLHNVFPSLSTCPYQISRCKPVTQQKKRRFQHKPADFSKNTQIPSKPRIFQQNVISRRVGEWVWQKHHRTPLWRHRALQSIDFKQKTKDFLPKGVVGAEGSHLYFGDL